jgi:hypothetical protein
VDNRTMAAMVASFLVFAIGLMLASAESDVAIEPLNFVGIAVMALGAALMVLVDKKAGNYGTPVSGTIYK